MKSINKTALVASLLTVSLALFATACKESVRDAAVDNSTSLSDSTNAVARDADNTSRNVADRNDANSVKSDRPPETSPLTPMDQGNTPQDLETSQKIRKSLVADTTLSTVAKNVKIITAGGKVTLRGPVKSETEKAGIVAMARSVAGDANVDDQLEVKMNQ